MTFRAGADKELSAPPEGIDEAEALDLTAEQKRAALRERAQASLRTLRSRTAVASSSSSSTSMSRPSMKVTRGETRKAGGGDGTTTTAAAPYNPYAPDPGSQLTRQKSARSQHEHLHLQEQKHLPLPQTGSFSPTKSRPTSSAAPHAASRPPTNHAPQGKTTKLPTPAGKIIKSTRSRPREIMEHQQLLDSSPMRRSCIRMDVEGEEQRKMSNNYDGGVERAPAGAEGAHPPPEDAIKTEILARLARGLMREEEEQGCRGAVEAGGEQGRSMWSQAVDQLALDVIAGGGANGRTNRNAHHVDHSAEHVVLQMLTQRCLAGAPPNNTDDGRRRAAGAPLGGGSPHGCSPPFSWMKEDQHLRSDKSRIPLSKDLQLRAEAVRQVEAITELHKEESAKMDAIVEEIGEKMKALSELRRIVLERKAALDAAKGEAEQQVQRKYWTEVLACQSNSSSS
mmetsp:Transcript_22202/g.55964  ORF Transcript_22202/g.55964 Transcript_22202/m.55964 type:complete len:453 (-) Transcript_22202:172-1530(-)